MNKILITGGSGYIGSHICHLLSTTGQSLNNCVSIDTVKRSESNGNFISADITNAEMLDKIFATFQFDIVIHLAALIEVGTSTIDPAAYYKTNLLGTLNILNAMVRYNVKKLLFSSSAAIYGIPKRLPIDEDHPIDPLSPYANTKYSCEMLIQDYARAYGLSYIIFRYFNAAGASPGQNLGEQHEPETHLIPRLIRSIINGQPCNVFGTDYPTIDGTCVRDYIHVKDIADAHLLALRHLSGNQSAILNLGSGDGTSILEIIKSIERLTSKKATINLLPRRPGDSPILIADRSNAAKILGWQPKHSLEQILKDAIAWEINKVRRTNTNQLSRL